MNRIDRIVRDDLSEPLTLTVEAHVSRDYAEAKGDRLWSKLWWQAGRLRGPAYKGHRV